MRSVVAELAKINESLADFGVMDRRHANAAMATASLEDRQACLVAIADEELRRRKLRSRYLPAQFFGEAAWSVLLDLYVSAHRNRPVATTSACIAADVPASTALRWLDLLEHRSLIERYDCGHDRRVKLVRLTSDGCKAVEAILSSY